MTSRAPWRSRSSLVAMIWLALMLPGSVCSAAQDHDSATALAQARLLINQGRPQGAIEKLTALGEAARPEVAHLLGVAYYHAEDHRQAIERLAPVVDRLPAGSLERREAVQVLGLSYFVMGRFPEALPLLEATRIWAADNTELGYVLGQTYVQTRQPDRARETFARTFGVAGDSAAAHLLAAQMMIRLEFESPAEAELRRRLKKTRSCPRRMSCSGRSRCSGAAWTKPSRPPNARLP